MKKMTVKDLVDAVELSDTSKIIELREVIKNHPDPWEIHLSLYPAVARVLNPPFINPHLPKMYHICRSFLPYLPKGKLNSLVYLELLEYARRAKLERMAPPKPAKSKVVFEDVERAIAGKDRDDAAVLLNAYLVQEGWNRLCKRLLMLGSGYLAPSLGHSISCTAFILLELLERSDADVRPMLFLLADYFCKGGFCETPPMNREPAGPLREPLSRAVTGTGFIDLHQTITLYSIEQVGPFLDPPEYGHLIAEWRTFLDGKEAASLPDISFNRIDGYDEFLRCISEKNAASMLACVGGMLDSQEDRTKLSSFLVAAVCDFYQGDYDPHYLTGLAASLWVIDRFHGDIVLARTALYQYLGFFLGRLKS